jgi:hypothetical protein
MGDAVSLLEQNALSGGRRGRNDGALGAGEEG